MSQTIIIGGRKVRLPDDPAEKQKIIAALQQEYSGKPLVETDSEGALGYMDTAKSSLIDDPTSKINFYSQQLGVPPDQFKVIEQGEYEGQLGYRTPDGTMQLVTPGNMRGFLQGVGPSLPAALGTAGAIVSAPFGPPGMALGGAGGASAGQFVKEAAANYLIDQPPSAARVATEGAIDITATFAGALVGKGFSRAAATDAAKQLTRAIKEAGGDTAVALKNTLDAVNAKYGTKIQLTPAELTNNADLRSTQMALEGRPASAPIMEDFAMRRADQTEEAFGRAMDDIAPASDMDQAGRALAQSSRQAMENVRIDRMREGSPVYDEAFEAQRAAGPIDLTPVRETIKQMEADYPRLAGRLRKVSKLLDNERAGDLQYLQDNVKEEIDDIIGTLKRSGSNKAARRMMELQGRLLGVADEQVPRYADARLIWGDLTRPVDEAEGGVLATVANAKPRDYAMMGRKIFRSASPAEVKRARDLIMKTDGGEQNWNIALRAYMEDVWETTQREFLSNISQPMRGKASQAARFYADMAGNKKQLARMRSAMTPEQFKAFRNLMDVFQATARATNFNSTTAAQREAQKNVDKLRPVFAIAEWGANPFSGTQKLIAESGRESNARELARILTDDDAIQELLKINKEQGMVKNAIIAAKVLNLGRASAGGYGAEPDPKQEQRSGSTRPGVWLGEILPGANR